MSEQAIVAIVREVCQCLAFIAILGLMGFFVYMGLKEK
jgi:hypothetical protein